MQLLLYTVIKSEEQYKEYCRKLEAILSADDRTEEAEAEAELLTVLIEKWDDDHNTFSDSDPVQLLKSLMDGHQMKAVELAELLGVSKGLVSDILHYRKGMSKDIIRKISAYFKVNQSAFNRPYSLKTAGSESRKSA